MGTNKVPNITFKRAWILGQLRVLAMLTRDVEEDEEYLTEYGDEYWESLRLLNE
jgi:hypothetical protein